MEDGDNPFVLLGLDAAKGELYPQDSSYSKEEIQAAWKKLIIKNHPDRVKPKTPANIRRATRLSCKLNAARDLLFDLAEYRKWKEESEDPSYQENHDGGYPQYEKSDMPRRPRRPRATTPGRSDLGNPYEGNMPMSGFSFDGDGSKGHEAPDGIPGRNGQRYGQHGTDGTAARAAGGGQDGKDLRIEIKVWLHEDGGFFFVSADATTGTDILDPDADRLRMMPLKAFEKVDWTAKGGHGGRGGHGGQGGKGHRGRNGANATKSRYGEDGGPGGDGGDGGEGTHGGPAGRGGHVELFIDRPNTYLLMRVAGCKGTVGNRVRGGVGGQAGTHGKGGKGGWGGAGGASYSWTTESYYSTVNSQGYYQQHTQTHYHSTPGGSDGPSGGNGHTPKTPLHDGYHGDNGTFEIFVRNENDAAVRQYEQIFDLAFVSTESKQVSDMQEEKTYEFGETVFVASCRVTNTGEMECPQQRVMIGVEAFAEVEVEPSDHRLYIKAHTNLEPGEEGEANEGYLKYDCPYPKNTSKKIDFDPIRKDGWLRYYAIQLGHENDTKDIQMLSDFQEKYAGFNPYQDKVHLRFPVENHDGLRGVRSLAAQETTFLRFTLKSFTNQSLGTESKSGRALFVQFYYADDQPYDIPLDQVQVRSDNGKIKDIDPSNKFRKTVAFLGGGFNTTLQLSLKLLGETISTASRAALQADVYVQKIPVLKPDGSYKVREKKQLIQRRIFTVSVQPKFVNDPDASIVLVITGESTKKQVAAWQRMAKELALKTQIYSLSRYGHIDSTQEVESTELKEGFADKLVVILNEEYNARPNAELTERSARHRPTKFLSSPFDFTDSSRFLVVGGEADSVAHLTPTSNAYTSTRDPSDTGPSILLNRKSFRSELEDILKKERADGFAAERVEPNLLKLIIKTQCVFEPNQEKMERICHKKAEVLSKWLNKQDRIRPYKVEWNLFADAPREVTKKTMSKLWEIGELTIRTGAPRFQNQMVQVSSDSTGNNRLNEPEAVHSQSMLYATLNALPFEKMMNVYVTSIHGLAADASSRKHKTICRTINDLLCSDFLWDVSNYYDGRMKVETVRGRSPTVRDLLESGAVCQVVEESQANDILKAALTGQLSRILAGFQASAQSKDLHPWWNPLSRKHKASKDLDQALGLLEQAWAHVVNEESVAEERAVIDESVKHHLKQIRKKVWLRARGRWRGGLNHVFSPRNETRYPTAAGFSGTTRVRRHFEFDVGETTKIKKAVKPETVTPTKKREVLVLQDEQRDLLSSVLSGVTQDDGDFRT